jgi:hypothetical protein
MIPVFVGIGLPRQAANDKPEHAPDQGHQVEEDKPFAHVKVVEPSDEHPAGEYRSERAKVSAGDAHDLIVDEFKAV